MDTKNDFMQTMISKVGPRHGVSEVDYHTISSIGLMIQGLGRIHEMTEFKTYDARKEMFVVTAEKRDSILKHGRVKNVFDRLSVPANMNITLNILLDDLIYKVSPNKDGVREYIIDKNSIITVGEFDFTLDYDIAVLVYKNVSDKLQNLGEYSVVANYILDGCNPISTITNSHIPLVSTEDESGERYVSLTLNVRQYKRIMKEYRYIEEVTSDNINFTYDNRLADFNVYYKETSFSDDKTLLDKTMFFDKVSSKRPTIFYKYIKDGQVLLMNRYRYGNLYPQRNSSFIIEVFETDGEKGNFEYFGDNITFNFNPNSEIIVDISIKVVSSSIGGTYEKSIEELRAEIIKMDRSRNTIITEEDLKDVYREFKGDDKSFFIKKVRDDFAFRVVHLYTSLKTEDNIIIPTNTMDLMLTDDSFEVVDEYMILDEKSIVKSKSPLYGYINDLPVKQDGLNTIMKLNGVKTNSSKMKSTDKNLLFQYYIPFKLCYDTVANMVTVHEAHVDREYLSTMLYNNKQTPLTCLISPVKFKRSYQKDDYEILFDVRTNLVNDEALLHDTDLNGSVVDNQFIKIKLVIECDNKRVGYIDVDMKGYNEETLTYNYGLKLNSNLKILGDSINITMKDIDTHSEVTRTVKVENIRMYVCTYQKELGTDDIQGGGTLPILEGYKIGNIYQLTTVSLFENWTYLTNIQADSFEKGTTVFTKVPLVAKEFIDTVNTKIFFDSIYRDMTFLDSIYLRTEQNYSVNLMLANTYGCATVYYIGLGTEIIDRTNIRMKFKVRIKDKGMLTTGEIAKYVSNYFDSINFFELERFHFSDLDRKIRADLTDIDIIEFVGINDYPYSMQLIESDHTQVGNYTVPDIINIDHYVDSDGNIVPSIDIELVM
ncbi:MAG: hypothetical protein ACRC92_26285 [Peptostreptococcaceae bacterium]